MSEYPKCTTSFSPRRDTGLCPSQTPPDRMSEYPKYTTSFSYNKRSARLLYLFTSVIFTLCLVVNHLCRCRTRVRSLRPVAEWQPPVLTHPPQDDTLGELEQLEEEIEVRELYQFEAEHRDLSRHVQHKRDRHPA